MRPARGVGMSTCRCSLTSTSRGVFVVEARDHETVQAFSLFLETHGGDPGQVQEVGQDMSEAFLKGTLTHLPKAEITFDRYHIKSHLSKAVDEVRREESKHQPRAASEHPVHVAKRPANLTERQRDLLDELLAQPLETVRAYTLSQQFDSFYEITDPDTIPPRRTCAAGSPRSTPAALSR
jgi:transposase